LTSFASFSLCKTAVEMNTQPSEKNEIRRQIAVRRPDLQTLENLSIAVIKKFQTLECFQSARAIGAYMPLPDEVDITPLPGFGSAGGVALPINREPHGGANSPGEPLPLHRKSFYIPAFDNDAGLYRMARLTPELIKGRFGIPEPAKPVFAAEDELDLLIVPGVAFDRAGGRIGRGGGFYDRLLPQYSAVRVGVCFEFQCVGKVPDEEHDVRMNWLVTEKRILKFAMNG
jgi:5-formyltetrahydrofolate cyclo-ligase